MKGIFVLSSGVIVGNLLSISIQPIVSRLYSPDEFGLYTLFQTMLAIFLPIVSLSLYYSIFSFKQLRLNIETKSIFLKISLFLFFYIFICFLISIFFLSAEVVNFFIALLTSILLGVFTLCQMIDIKSGRFSRKSVFYMVFIFCLSVSKIVFYFLIDEKKMALQYGHLSSVFLVVFIYAIRNEAAHIVRLLKFKRVRSSSLRIIFKYSIQKTSSTLLNSISILMPTIFLYKFFNTEEVGLYGMAYSVGMAPMILVGGALYEFLLNRMSLDKYYFVKKINYINLFIFFFLMLAIFTSSIFYFYGGELLELIFGKGWGGMNVYLSSILLWTLIGVGVKPYLALIATCNAEKENFQIELLFFLIRMSMLVYFIYQPSAAATVVFAYAFSIVAGDLAKLPLAFKVCSRNV